MWLEDGHIKSLYKKENKLVKIGSMTIVFDIIIKILLIIMVILITLCIIVFIAPLFMLDFRNGDECHECIGCPYLEWKPDHCENCYINKRFQRYVKRYKNKKI